MTTLAPEAADTSETIRAAAALDFGRLSPHIRRDLRKLCRLDNHHALIAIAFDYALIAVAVYLCVGVSFWFYPLSLVLIGSTQRALVNILHESSHKVLAKNATLNVILGTACSGHLVLHVYNAYRSSHIGLHHRYLGDPGRDPDYSFHCEIGIYDPASSNRTFFLRNLLFAVLGLRSIEYLRYVAQDRLMFRREQVAVSMPIDIRVERCVLGAVWTAILVLCALTGSWLALALFWIVPMLTTAVAVGWLSELAEHYPLPESEDRQILMTRNRHGWLLERFLLGRHHDNYHLVHHLNTGIPFWNMKKAHQVLLGDPAYACWDGLWAGIMTRGRRERDRETVFSYAASYRDWRRSGGDLRALDRSFAELAAMRMPVGPAAAASGPSAGTAGPATASTATVTKPVHLNTAGAGLPAPGVLAAMTEQLALEAELGPYEAEERRAEELTSTVYARLAELVGGGADEIALFGSATDAWCRTVCQLRIPRGSRLWVTRYEYAGNLIALQRIARARGCELEVIPCLPDGELDLDWIRASLDDRVALVSVVHMPSGAGVVLPVEEVGALLAGSGAVYIVDACQTVGQLPVDVRDIGCHALTGAGRKFLRGPRGSGFGYLRADLRDRIEASWYDLHVAEARSLHEHRVTDQTAARFETAERSSATVLGLLAAAEYTLDGPGGPDADVKAGLLDAVMTTPGVRLLAPRPVPCAIVSFVHESCPAERIVAGLAADGVTGWVAHGAHTPLYLAEEGVSEFVRISVHHYTSMADIELFKRSLRRVARSG